MCSANDQTIGAVSVDDGRPHPEAGPDWVGDREGERPAATGEGAAPPSAMTGPPAPAAAASHGRWSRWAPVVARVMNRRSARAMPPAAAPLTTRVSSAALVTPEHADTDEPLVEESASDEQVEQCVPVEPVEPVAEATSDEQVEQFVPVEPAEEPAQVEQPQYYTPAEYPEEWAWAEPVVHEFPAEPEVPPAVAVTSPLPVPAGVESAEESAPADGTESAAGADEKDPVDAKQETTAQEEVDPLHTTPRRALDIGLLILRVAVGAAALMHGLQKLVGVWDGPGLTGFESILANAPDPSIGFDGSATGWLAPLGAIAETAGGALLIVGLVSPVAASTVLGVLVVGVLYRVTLAGGLWYFTDSRGGIEYSVLLICASLVILLLGPGRFALDYGRGWTTRPKWGSWLLAVLGIGAAVALWVVFNGTNPLDSPGNPG